MSKHILCLFVTIISLTFVQGQEYRSITGKNNNPSNPDWGSTFSTLIRISPADYVDGIGIPKLDETFGKPNPRVISNAMFDQPELINSDRNLSDFTWSFGQFIDHDLSLIHDNPNEFIGIDVPADDLVFASGSKIPMSRSAAAEGTGVTSPRNYNNEVSSYLDGSMVYGSTESVANWLRTFKDGKLKMSEGDLLPWNTIDGEFNSQTLDDTAPEMDDPLNELRYYFVAGDSRANENPLLLSFHTLFVREHNRLCDIIKNDNPFWSDEKIYQTARRKNIAFIQNITFEEWLPAMGVVLPPYQGYDATKNLQIFNEFSAAAFRFGHTLINSNIVRMENDGDLIPRGNTTLKDAFFNPYIVILSGGIEPFIKGMATQVQQELDCKVIDDVRNFLFAGGPNGIGLDLAAININRGRERGIPSYNEVRGFFGLPMIPSFYELTHNTDEADLLAEIYGDISNLDLWVGLLAETHMEESMMGRLMQVIIKEQFQLIRDADRFYFENDPDLSPSDIREIKETTMRDIIMRNTGIELMQSKVFEAMPHEDIPTAPEVIPVEFDATLRPTLVDNMTTLTIFTNTESNATIQIIGVNGNVISTIERSLIAGKNVLYLDIDSELPHGVYNLLIYNEKSYNILKFVKG